MQISFFEGSKRFKIDKPIRLIELFAGIGSQAKALTNLGVDFEHYRICEFDKHAVKSYNAVHGTNFERSDITEITANDLGIVDTDKYCYIMTYSFPCQDLSNAGKQAGMAKGSGTRSGLLWEVERLLDECKELPQVLVMENVPQVIGQGNVEHFAKWVEKLEQLGYKNKWQVLNAKDYGIPQNRERCFMVSILGDYYYDFPKTIPLKLRLKDMLEKKVDDKYYLSEKMIKYIVAENELWTGNNGEATINKIVASIINTGEGSRRCDASNYICEDLPEDFNLKLIEPILLCESGKTIKENKRQVAYTLQAHLDKGITGFSRQFDNGVLEIEYPKVLGGIGEKKSNGGTQWYQQDRIYNNEIAISGTTSFNPFYKDCDYRIRKLTPKECWRLMGFEDADIDKAIAVGMRDAQLYKQAGNSIVVNVLMAIFSQMI